MASAARALSPLLRQTDVVLEVRDARLPFSTANPALRALAGSRPRVIVLNKADLADSEMEGRVRSAVAAAERAANVGGPPPAIVFARAGGKGGARGGAAAVVAAVDAALATTQPSAATVIQGFALAVIGVPNVGKSSLINALRAAAAASGDAAAGAGALGSRASVAPEPGHTRNLRAVRVRGPPSPLWVWDAPGVAEPRLRGVEHGMKLAVAACVRGASVPIAVQAEYLLYAFNTLGVTDWAAELGLSRAYDEDGVRECLQELAGVMGVRRGGGGGAAEAEEDIAAAALVRSWREGRLGRHTLDFVPQLLAATPRLTLQHHKLVIDTLPVKNIRPAPVPMTLLKLPLPPPRQPLTQTQTRPVKVFGLNESVARRRGLF